MTTTLDATMDDRLAQMDCAALRKQYVEQDEFVVVEDFLPEATLAQWRRELSALQPHIHRNFIPKHKKGGSVAFATVDRLGPSLTGVYRHPAVLRFLQAIVNARIEECPDSDPHRCALYSYTEEGDHIGWHYDTSYYKDRRWTVLVGLEDESSSRLLSAHAQPRASGRKA